MKLFCENLKSFLLQIDKTGIQKVIIAGDFNENLLQNNQTILDTMTSKGYNQVIHSPTTEGGTLIDHVYVRGIEQDTIKTSIISTYFSFHDAIEIVIGLWCGSDLDHLFLIESDMDIYSCVAVISTLIFV